MQLDEFKDLWHQYDKKLDKQIQLNIHLLRKIELRNTRSALRKLMVGPILSIVSGALMLVALGPFIFNHFSLPRFAAPAILLAINALFMIISSAYQLLITQKIDYDGAVTAIQQNVEKLRIHRIRYTTYLGFSWGLLWLLVPIVGLKALGDIDFYALFDHVWIASNIALGLAIIALAIWLVRHHTTDQITQPWLKKFMDNMSGANLAKAKASLKEIEAFARED